MRLDSEELKFQKWRRKSPQSMNGWKRHIYFAQYAKEVGFKDAYEYKLLDNANRKKLKQL